MMPPNKRFAGYRKTNKQLDKFQLFIIVPCLEHVAEFRSHEEQRIDVIWLLDDTNKNHICLR